MKTQAPSCKLATAAPWICLLGLIAVGCVSLSTGLSRPPKLQDLVRRSDLIVLGKSSRVTLDSVSVPPIAMITVVTERVIWGEMVSYLLGAVAGEESLTVVWIEPEAPGLVNPLELMGQSGIWLLVRSGGDTYLADDYSFVQSSKHRAVERFLKRDFLFIRVNATAPEEMLTVDLVIRNAGKEDHIIPEFRYLNGKLFLHPQIDLSVFAIPAGKGEPHEPISPREGAILPLDEQDWITAQAGEEILVSVPLTAIFPLESARTHEVRFEIEGVGEGRLVLAGRGIQP
ncbi:MAG: hypothetical protein V3W14_01545 [Candidatus Neomarinimicrobiota bacterium]